MQGGSLAGNTLFGKLIVIVIVIFVVMVSVIVIVMNLAIIVILISAKGFGLSNKCRDLSWEP